MLHSVALEIELEHRQPPDHIILAVDCMQHPQ